MSRVFTQNLSNYMSLGVSGLGSILSGKSIFSLSAKIRLAGNTFAQNDNNIIVAIINGSTIGAVLNIDGTSTPRVRISARSVSTDARQGVTGTSTIPFGVDVWVGGVVDIAGDAITVYVDGVQDATSSVTFANAVWTLGTPTGADTIGGYLAPPTATSDQFAGRIGQVAIWGSGLAGSDFLSLKNGTPASSVQAGTLVYYLPIKGVTSPEPPTVGAPSGTITGSLPVGDELEQYGYQPRNDDGSETTATSAGPQNTPFTAPTSTTRRLRFGVNATGDPASQNYKVQYRKVGAAAWRNVDKFV